MSNDRPITIKVVNSTLEDLDQNDGSTSLIHGKWTTDPATIPAGDTLSFGAENRNWTAVGPEGRASWIGSTSKAAFVITFNHPFGGGQTTVTPSAAAGYNYAISDDDLQNKSASCTVTFTVNNNA